MEKYIGDEGTWENAEKAIINATRKKSDLILLKEKLHFMDRNLILWYRTPLVESGN